MRTVRIFQPIKLSVNLVFELTAAAANHLVRVLRFALDDEFIVFNGEGGEYCAKIILIKKQQVIVQVLRYQDFLVESPLEIHLGQAVSRGEKMDFTIQKAVELGVKTITPLMTERCGVKLTSERWDKKIQHWNGIIIAACEQSGRDKIPNITPPMQLAKWLSEFTADLNLILHPFATQKLSALTIKSKSINLLIGPEGGFEEYEVNLAQSHKFMPLRLGPRILRTETAALTAIAALQTQFGDF